MSRKVIHPKRLPSFLPITPTAVGYLILDRFAAPEWGWGVFWTVAAIIWICILTDVLTREYEV